MSLSSGHDDRFKYEGDGRVDGMTRDAAGKQVAAYDALLEKFLLEAAAFAAGVKLINPDFVDRWEHATRARTASHEEAAQGFVDVVADNVSDFSDHGAIERQRLIAETGRDE